MKDLSHCFNCDQLACCCRTLCFLSRLQMGETAGVPEQTHHAHSVWPQGQRSSCGNHSARHFKVGKIKWTLSNTCIKWIVCKYNVILYAETTVRFWWVTAGAECSAGLSAISRDAPPQTTGWRTSRWTAALGAPYASRSLKDATTAETAARSSARSKTQEHGFKFILYSLLVFSV